MPRIECHIIEFFLYSNFNERSLDVNVSSVVVVSQRETSPVQTMLNLRPLTGTQVNLILIKLIKTIL